MPPIVTMKWEWTALLMLVLLVENVIIVFALFPVAALGLAASVYIAPLEVSIMVDRSSPIVNQHQALKYFDVKMGTGDAIVDEGRTVQFLWSLRRANGYFVDSSNNYNNEPFIYKVGNTKTVRVINGIDQGIRGMRVGGIRRIDVPPELAYAEGVEASNPGPIPASFGSRRQILSHSNNEVWHFEIKVVKIK